jgi:hypothetical protein
MKMNKYFDTNIPEQKIKVNVDYALGGINYFTGGMSPRGVYAYVTNVKQETHELPGGDKWTSESFSLFSGGNLKVMLVPLNRKSQKVIDGTWEKVQKDLDARTGRIWEVVQKVAGANNLTIN